MPLKLSDTVYVNVALKLFIVYQKKGCEFGKSILICPNIQSPIYNLYKLSHHVYGSGHLYNKL